MALVENNKTGGVKFLKIADYSIAEKYSTEQEGWEVLKTQDNAGKQYTSWIKRYKAVEGLITKIEFTKRTLPGTTTELSSWNIHLLDKDVNERYVLSIPATSPAASRFVKLAENIDPSLPVEIAAWKDTSDAKPKQAFMVKQVGNNVPQKYSIKDNALTDYANPNWEDAPALKIRRNGDKDWSAIEDFLFERMDTVVIPRFAQNAEVVAESEVDLEQGEEEADEIPF